MCSCAAALASQGSCAKLISGNWSQGLKKRESPASARSATPASSTISAFSTIATVIAFGSFPPIASILTTHSVTPDLSVAPTTTGQI